MKEETFNFETFAVKVTKDKLYLYTKKIDDLGNPYFTVDITLVTDSSRDHYSTEKTIKQALLKLIEFKKENDHLAFYRKAEDNLK
jgi:hypothetical protein